MRNSHTVLPPHKVNTPSIQHSPTLITLKKMRAKQTGKTHRENRNVGHRCIDEEQWGLRGGPTVCRSSFESANHSEGKTSAGAYLPPAGGRENEKARRASAYESCGNKHCPTSMH